MEGNALGLEPGEPVPPDEFPVGQERLDSGLPELLHKALQERGALLGIGIAGFVENRPHHWQGHALVGDPQDQEVDLGLAEFPVGAV